MSEKRAPLTTSRWVSPSGDTDTSYWSLRRRGWCWKVQVALGQGLERVHSKAASPCSSQQASASGTTTRGGMAAGAWRGAVSGGVTAGGSEPQVQTGQPQNPCVTADGSPLSPAVSPPVSNKGL